jgi:hypothetical protein
MISEQDRDDIHSRLNKMLDKVEWKGLERFTLEQNPKPIKAVIYALVQKTIENTIEEVRKELENVV